jgi:hypothetical protein
MRHLICNGCKTEIPTIQFRTAHWNESDLPCDNPTCTRWWSFEEIDHILDKVDARRLKKRLEPHLDKGKDCPCCGQRAKRYKRKLNSGMARTLLQFFVWAKGAADADGWVGVGKDHMTKQMCLTYHQGEFHKLRWWTLIEQRDDDVKEGHRSEFWRLTDLGRNFAEDKVTVTARAVVFDNKCVGFDGPQINIKNALGEKFDYAELMSA